MSEIDNDIFGFMEDFFVSVGAKVDYEGDLMKVMNVPKNIQDSLGKQGDYLFSVIDTGRSDVELLTKGSFLIKSMNDYIKNKGQTTILKIDFSKNIENLKIPIVLKEGEIYSQEKKEIMDYINRFTFATDFQYLNDKEQVLNDIYVKGDDILDIDLNGLRLMDGDPKEINYKDVNSSYTLAKNSIKHKLKPSIEKLSKTLSEKLDKELERINNHYGRQDEEINEKLKKLENQMVEATKESDSKKLERIENEIKQLKEKLMDKVKEMEKNFFIQDEINKHSLNLSTKLVNSTILYYPNYKFNIHLKNKKSMRAIEISFDPFHNKFSTIHCDSCKMPLSEMHLCSSGHISCNNCPKDRCNECSLIICKACTKKECNICRNKICRKCDKQCSVCYKSVCTNHSSLEKMSNKVICNNCGRNCCKCNGWFDNKKLKMFGPKKICEACFRLNSVGK